MAYLDDAELMERIREETTDLLLTGEGAARLLVLACEEAIESEGAKGSNRELIEVVRRLSVETEGRLASLASALITARKTGHVVEARLLTSLAEGAQAIGDLATIAACNAKLLTQPARAARVAKLCHESTTKMQETFGKVEGWEGGRASRDIRGSTWKASLAVDQTKDL